MYLHEILSDIRLALAVGIFCTGAACGIGVCLLSWFWERKRKREEMSTIEAFEKLMSAVREMSEIMYDQAKLIEEQEAISIETKAMLAARRDYVKGELDALMEETAI